MPRYDALRQSTRDDNQMVAAGLPYRERAAGALGPQSFLQGMQGGLNVVRGVQDMQIRQQDAVMRQAQHEADMQYVGERTALMHSELQLRNIAIQTAHQEAALGLEIKELQKKAAQMDLEYAPLNYSPWEDPSTGDVMRFVPKPGGGVMEAPQPGATAERDVNMRYRDEMGAAAIMRAMGGGGGNNPDYTDIRRREQLINELKYYDDKLEKRTAPGAKNPEGWSLENDPDYQARQRTFRELQASHGFIGPQTSTEKQQLYNANLQLPIQRVIGVLREPVRQAARARLDMLLQEGYRSEAQRREQMGLEPISFEEYVTSRIDTPEKQESLARLLELEVDPKGYHRGRPDPSIYDRGGF